MPASDALDPVFQAAGQEWNVDPQLLKAMAAQESGGNPRAVSKAGAQGLMQIIPQTQKYLGVTDPNDPVQSIYGAAKYMSEALDAEKTPEDALRYYHGGPNWRDAYGPESKAYAPAVTAQYQKLTKAAPAAASPGAPGSAAVAGPGAYGALSDADFLKATSGNGPAPASQEDDAAFLARTGGKLAPAETAAPLPRSVGVDDFGRPIPDATDAEMASPVRLSDAPMPKSVADIRNLLAETPGWTSSSILPLRVKNDATGHADMSLGVRPDLGPLRGIGTGLLDLLEGPRTGTVTPAARSLLFGAMTGGGLAPSVARGTGVGISDAVEAPLSGAFRANPGVTTPSMVGDTSVNRLVPGAATTNRLAGEPTPAAAPGPAAAGPQSAGPQAPGPQSVGAAASRDMSHPSVIDMTPAEVQAYRSTAEGQKLLEPQPVGADHNRYVPGVDPNQAELEQSANTARELKALNTTAPEVSEEQKAISATNNEARQRYFESIAGSDVSVANAKAARAAQAETDLAEAWKNKTDADAQPVIDAANAIKASPDGRRPLVRNAVDGVTREMFDADGKLLTDPEQLYGVRKHIDDLMSKEAGADDPKSVRAMANLATLKSTLDTVINKAAPGFDQYLKNFSEASKPIYTMEVLQKHENKLYDAQNRMQPSRVQAMMRQIVDSRAAPGINPYKSIPDETMAKLWALRDDLRRSASAQELARTAGSDTAQNLWDTTKGLARIGGEAGAHVAANALSPGFGSLGLHMAKTAIAPLTAARTARKQTARGMQLLHPDPLKFPPPNRLVD